MHDMTYYEKKGTFISVDKTYVLNNLSKTNKWYLLRYE